MHFFSPGEWCGTSPIGVCSGSGQLCVDRLLVPVLGTVVGLGNGRNPCRVSDGCIHGPLAGAHVAEGGVQAGALTSSVGVIGVGAALVVRVVVLCPGDGRERSAVVLEVLDVEGAVGDLLWRTLIVVVAGAELLGFDVCRSRLLLFSSQLGVRRAAVLRLPHPGGISAYVGCIGGMPVRRQVLIKLVDVERFNDSRCWARRCPRRGSRCWAGVPCFPEADGPLRFRSTLPCCCVSLRSGGRSGRPLGLACLETVEEGREVRAPFKRWRNSQSQGKQLRQTRIAKQLLVINHF